ncbi:DUF3043 domain-containing protein [Ancrocorticia populi]|uniref:DUF3043 domain-containing protein n=2 Tax=Ancrocorticia populi TaxID=2175228 RepID=A0A2V1K001_9ACTO|nr:DUF3043 domain-containing protein [Ancrocorticia populi]PWF24526.1 DUF3043 domain-containing protein [Ancrocorticia populi]
MPAHAAGLTRDGEYVFKDKKEIPAEETPEESVPHLPKGYSPKKGTPTPRRRDVEAAQRTPLISDRSKMSKAEKKAQKAADRAKADASWQKEQRAMKTGDERNMPIQHAGPVRRFARDYLDARGGIGVGFMPLAVVLLVTIIIQGINPDLFIIITLCVYALFILMIVDSAWATHNARRLCQYRFGSDKVPPRFTWQMFTRTFYLRRWKLPIPMVKRGEYPEGGTPADLKAARKAHRANKKSK